MLGLTHVEPTSLFPLLAATFACPFLFAADPYAVDWKSLQPEILEHYSNLIRIDTSSPPGNETKAAEYVKKVLEREGILIYEPTGMCWRGERQRIEEANLLMGHLDCGREAKVDG